MEVKRSGFPGEQLKMKDIAKRAVPQVKFSKTKGASLEHVLYITTGLLSQEVPTLIKVL